MQQLSNQGDSNLNVSLNPASRSAAANQETSQKRDKVESRAATAKSSVQATSKSTSSKKAAKPSGTSSKAAKSSSASSSKKVQRSTTQQKVREKTVRPAETSVKKRSAAKAASVTPRAADELAKRDNALAENNTSSSRVEHDIRGSRINAVSEESASFKHSFGASNNSGTDRTNEATDNAAPSCGVLGRVVNFLKGLFKK